MSDSTSMTGEDDGDLRDPVLQRALHNAPDQAAAPDWRLGDSIRAMAHEAVAPSLPEGLVGAQRPWWQRFLGIGAGGGRLPRNAAFATVLLGVLVTATWHQQEIPGARPDGEDASKMTSRNEPAAPAPEASAPPAAPAPSTAAVAEATKQAEVSAPLPAAAPSPSTLEAALAESRAVADAAARAMEKDEQARQRQAARVRQAETDAAAALARLQGRPPPSAFSPPPPAPRAPMVAMPSNPAPPPAATADAAAAPERRALQTPDNELGFAKRSAAGAVPSAPTAARAESAAPPTFNALSQWTRLRISRAGGDGKSLARAEARDLGALVGSAALAGVGAQPLSGGADWRIALERNGEVLAVLELAGGQVRWRENGAAPGTGSPGAGALAALREALEEAAAAAPPPVPAAPAAPAAPAR